MRVLVPVGLVVQGAVHVVLPEDAVVHPGSVVLPVVLEPVVTVVLVPESVCVASLVSVFGCVGSDLACSSHSNSDSLVIYSDSDLFGIHFLVRLPADSSLTLTQDVLVGKPDCRLVVSPDHM